MVKPMTAQTDGHHRLQVQGAPGISPAVRPEPLAYRVQDACHALGIGRTSLYELVKTGELKLIRVAGRSLVPRSELERLTRVDRAA
jgi:excisionase family DNA binding protein